MQQEQSLARGKAEEALFRDSFGFAFANHTYRQPLLTEELENITPQKMLEFHASHYRPDNMLLVISGPVTPGKAFAMARDAYANVQNPDASKYVRSERA